MSGPRAALAGLTTRGRCLLAAGLTLVACAVVLGQRDLLRAGVFLVVLPLAAVALVSRTRYRLACSRTLDPPRVPAGTPADVLLVLENVSRLPTGVLLMEDLLPYAIGGRPRFVLDRVEPQGRRSVRYPVRSDVRGRFAVGPLSVRLADPFGLVELVRRFAETDELVVTPVVTPLPAVRLGGDRSGGGESSSRAVAASGSDDTATREYRHGDDLRRVHWKSTARVGELMVRREEQPFSSRATLLLDGRAEAHRGAGPGSTYERAVSAVASIGVALARTGSGLRLLDSSGRDLVPPSVPVTEAVLLDTLATVTTDRGSGLGGAVARLRGAGLDGVLVAVLGRLGPDDAERLARLRTGTRTCVAVLVDPEPDPDAVRSTEALLTGTGWRVLRVDPSAPLDRVWPAAARDAPAPHLLPAR